MPRGSVSDAVEAGGDDPEPRAGGRGTRGPERSEKGDDEQYPRAGECAHQSVQGGSSRVENTTDPWARTNRATASRALTNPMLPG